MILIKIYLMSNEKRKIFLEQKKNREISSLYVCSSLAKANDFERKKNTKNQQFEQRNFSFLSSLSRHFSYSEWLIIIFHRKNARLAFQLTYRSK